MNKNSVISAAVILIGVALSSCVISVIDKKHACVTRENGSTGPGIIYGLEVGAMAVLVFILYEVAVKAIMRKKGMTERTGFAGFTPFN